MSVAMEIFTVGAKVLDRLLSLERSQRLKVAQHFDNLCATFKAFPSAHRTKNPDDLAFLVGQTKGLIASLEGTGIFADVLGKEKAEAFFTTIKKVENLKEMMQAGGYGSEAAAYAEILHIAGYFDGYAKSLKVEGSG